MHVHVVTCMYMCMCVCVCVCVREREREREKEERRGGVETEGMHVCELVCVSMHTNNAHLLHPQVLFYWYCWYLATS